MKSVKGIKKNTKKTVAPQIAVAAAIPKPPAAKVTTIEVKADVGFGNAVYLRGQGPGLNWERGIALACVDGKTWRWSTKGAEMLKFKPLLNDSVWAQGEDLVAVPGQKVEVAPVF